MRIDHNIAALNTYSRLASSSAEQAKSLERLSSGQNINKTGDDAAGLSVMQKVKADNTIRTFDTAASKQQLGTTTRNTDSESGIKKQSSMGDILSLSNAGIIRSRSEGGIALRDSIKDITQQANKDSQQAFKDVQQRITQMQQMQQDMVQHIQKNMDDFDLESMTNIKKSVLNQASTAMLAQANTTPQAALQLLR